MMADNPDRTGPQRWCETHDVKAHREQAFCLVGVAEGIGECRIVTADGRHSCHWKAVAEELEGRVMDLLDRALDAEEQVAQLQSDNAAEAALAWLRNKGARLFVRGDERGYELVRELRGGLSKILNVKNPEG